MPQDEVLRPRGAPDRIGLHKAECGDGAPIGIGLASEPRTARDRTLASVSFPVIRSVRRQDFPHALGRAAQTHATRSDHHRALHQDGMRQDGVDQFVIRLFRVVEAEVSDTGCRAGAAVRAA